MPRVSCVSNYRRRSFFTTFKGIFVRLNTTKESLVVRPNQKFIEVEVADESQAANQASETWFPGIRLAISASDVIADCRSYNRVLHLADSAHGCPCCTVFFEG